MIDETVTMIMRAQRKFAGAEYAKKLRAYAERCRAGSMLTNGFPILDAAADEIAAVLEWVADQD